MTERPFGQPALAVPAEPASGLSPSGFDQAHGLTIAFCGPTTCEHDFQGWREFDDGLGGEQVCTKCGIGAMEATMWEDF